MYFQLIYLMWKYRKFYYNIMLILKLYYVYYKMKKNLKIVTEKVDDWIFVSKIEK